MGEGHQFSHSCWAGHKFGYDDVTSRRAAGLIVYFSNLLSRAKLADTASSIILVRVVKYYNTHQPIWYCAIVVDSTVTPTFHV